mmetsp:Transcript_12512/g.29830  ORF Transcript_12512/g.29830 Transcript_12512/m.29830 type:complete len:238 (+) Transcript_12512:915-1628(+)
MMAAPTVRYQSGTKSSYPSKKLLSGPMYMLTTTMTKAVLMNIATNTLDITDACNAETDRGRSNLARALITVANTTFTITTTSAAPTEAPTTVSSWSSHDSHALPCCKVSLPSTVAIPWLLQKQFTKATELVWLWLARCWAALSVKFSAEKIWSSTAKNCDEFSQFQVFWLSLTVFSTRLALASKAPEMSNIARDITKTAAFRKVRESMGMSWFSQRMSDGSGATPTLRAFPKNSGVL